MVSQIIHDCILCTQNKGVSYELFSGINGYSLRSSILQNSVDIVEFTVNRNFSLFVFEKIVIGAAHPCHLKDIVEDFICEYDPLKNYGEVYEGCKFT